MSAWLEEELRSITVTDDKHIAPSNGLEALEKGRDLENRPTSDIKTLLRP